jgi:hypothetical protein
MLILQSKKRIYNLFRIIKNKLTCIICMPTFAADKQKHQ